MSIPGWYSKYFHWFLDCRHQMSNFITEISTFVSKSLGNTEELFDWYKTTVIPISMPQNNSIFAKKCQKIFCHALQNVHLSNSPTSQVCKVGSPLAILAANFTLFESILWHERPILRPRGAKMFVPESKAWKMKDFTGIEKQSRNPKSLRLLPSKSTDKCKSKIKPKRLVFFVLQQQWLIYRYKNKA